MCMKRTVPTHARARIYVSFTVVLLLLLIMIPQVAISETCTEREARNEAENWLRMSVKTIGHWANTTDPSLAGEEQIVAYGQTVGRVFLVEPEGWIVVPSLKELPPVIACSDEGSLDFSYHIGMPELVREVLFSRYQAFENQFGKCFGHVAAGQPVPFLTQSIENSGMFMVQNP